MNIPDVPMQVEVDPNEDTEWNDILRKHGIIPEKPPSPTPIIEEALSEARRLAHENRLEGKNLDELDELEGEEEDEFLERYRLIQEICRQQRLQELSTITQTSIYNQVYFLQKPDYARDVTEVSKKSFVFVLLTSSLGTNIQSALLTNMWRELAQRYGNVKFCQIRADLCIESYPERNTPTILIYRDGDIKKQVVTLREILGDNTSVTDIEKLLVEIGAVKQNDPRMKRRDEEHPRVSNGKIRGGNTNATVDDDDSDWE